MAKEILIFCQQPSDTQYVFDLYNKYKDNNDVSIIVGVEKVYRFIKSQNIKLKKLLYFPLKSICWFNPYSISNARKQFLYYFNQIGSIKNYDIYYFTPYFDWMTLGIVERIRKKNIVYFINYQGPHRIYKNSINEWFKGLLWKTAYYIITNIWFSVIKIAYYPNVLYYPTPSTVKEIKDYKINSNKLFKINICSEDNSILFFDDGSLESYFINYIPRLNFIIDKLSSKYTIYIKPHPRTGVSCAEYLMKYKIIENNVLGEFIDTSKFKYVISISSSAIISIANNQNVFSLMKLFEFKNKTIKMELFEYVNRCSNEKMKYIENINELLS